ncbi:MAG: alpha/beta hydrolase [Cyclobacteriaceae bacterium]
MKILVTLLISLFIMNLVQGQEVLPLYPKGIPNSKPAPDTEKSEVTQNGMHIISAISIPTLTVFLPETPAKSRTAVIIFPGGGYHINAIKHEGLDVARKFNEWGVAAFVLKYRIPSDATMGNKEIGPLQDAQQAIRMIRENATKWKIDPNKIGIMGFSAGGHLASTAATHFKTSVLEDAQNANLRPDFLVLGYPVISFSDSIGHLGSRENLLGKSPSSQKIREYSNELQVTSETPPTFIIHAGDDKGVLPANSIAFYESLLKHNVPAELHIYERGGHGFGMDNPTTTEKWMTSLKNWLVSRELLIVK